MIIKRVAARPAAIMRAGIIGHREHPEHCGNNRCEDVEEVTSCFFR